MAKIAGVIRKEFGEHCRSGLVDDVSARTGVGGGSDSIITSRHSPKDLRSYFATDTTIQ